MAPYQLVIRVKLSSATALKEVMGEALIYFRRKKAEGKIVGGRWTWDELPPSVPESDSGDL